MLLLLAACAGSRGSTAGRPEPAGSRTEPSPIAVEPPAVRTFLAHRLPDPPAIDGRLDDAAWADVAWTEPFTDIEGPRRPGPHLLTRAKLAWDEAHLYIGASLEEPHLQGSLVRRDTVIYLDNDFEVFLDPDGDTHDYFELEINALGTEWDLRLTKPYRDGGRADHTWDIGGLRTAVALAGTLNDPSDRDRGWSVEIAIPFAALGLAAPAPGEQWRVNFSRVEWTFDAVDGGYRKRLDPAGRPLAEANWVWSPQGAVNMHMPEMWGIVEFGAQPPGREDPPVVSPLADHQARWSLRRVYYAQRIHRRARGTWAERLEDLGLTGLPADLRLVVPPHDSAETQMAKGKEAGGGAGWEAIVSGASGAEWRIRSDGRIGREGRQRQ